MLGNIGFGTTVPLMPVHAVTPSSTNGFAAVYGHAISGAGEVAGVSGRADSGIGRGVHGEASANTLSFAYGVYGVNHSVFGAGVTGQARTTVGVAAGVFGNSVSTQGRGVFGSSFESTGTGIGVYGEALSASGYGVFSQGRFGATGSKGFVQPHPSNPAKSVFFVCLEGNENGTYFRGSARLIRGVAEIPIPEEWRLVSEATGITVQLTPLDSFARLTVRSKNRDRIVVAGTEDCEFDYFVNGVRRGFAKYRPYQDNHEFRPLVRGIPYGGQFPRELRDLLVQNGTLNTDYTPNESTAARLGWELIDPEEVPVAERWWLRDPVKTSTAPTTESRSAGS